MIDCREAVRRMWPFLDRSLEPHPTEELETHLEPCKRCGGARQVAPPKRPGRAGRAWRAGRATSCHRARWWAGPVTSLHAGHLEGSDFLQQDAIRAAVRETYATVRPTDRRVAERFYDRAELAGLPEDTVRVAPGGGDPIRYADL